MGLVTASSQVSIGCYAESKRGYNRDLPFGIVVSPMNIESCIEACRNAGYLYAGAQFR